MQAGTACSFDQEIVAMGMPAAAGGAVQMHRLGKTHERIVATPDINQLLARAGGQPAPPAP